MRRSPAYIASLDGLRAGAVAIVFLGHGLPPPFPGELGVTVFFFLSGYLITTLLRAEFEAKGSISLRAFYARRVLRIFPPFYLALTGATILAALGALGPARLTAATVISQATYLTNYFLVAGEWFPGIPWGGAAGTGVYWSLAVEEHFYLFFPLLYLALLRHLPSRRRQAAVLVAVCALVLAWRCFLVFGLHSGKDRTYVATDARIDSILFGCILAVAGNPVLDDSRISGRTWKAVLLPLGLLGLLAGFAVRSQAFHESFRYTLQGICLVPIFVVAIRHPEWGPMRALNWRWVRFLGVLSYSMYLVHLTVLSGLEARLRAPLAVRTSAGAVITVALAYAVHRLVEKPLARWRRRLSRLDRAPAPEAPALRGPIQPAAAQLGDRLAGGMSSMRRTMVSIVKGTLHRYGYDLVRLTGPSAPPVDLTAGRLQLHPGRVPPEGRLGRALHPQAEVGDHVQVRLGGLAARGQVVAGEDRVGQQQPQRLERPQVDLAAAGDPHLDVREEQPVQSQDAQAAPGVELVTAGERRPLHRDQEVDRHRVRPQAAEGEADAHHVLVALAQAEQHARAG